MSVTVKPDQNLRDICLEHFGTVDVVAELARLNSLELDAELTPGTVLITTAIVTAAPLIVETIKRRRITVSSVQ